MKANSSKAQGEALPLGDAVVALDATHRVTFFNPGAEQLFGRRAAEVLGQPVGQLLAPRLAAEIEAAMSELQAGCEAARVANGSNPLVGVDPSGREIWLEGTMLKLVRDDPHSPLLAVLRELADGDEQSTRPAQAPAGPPLAVSLEQHLEALLRQASMAIWVKDRAGRYLTASKAYVALLGRDETEAIGRSDADLMPAAAARTMRRHDRAALRAGTPCEQDEELELAGGRRAFKTLRVPLYGKDKFPIALCGITTDLEATKKAQLRNAQLAAIIMGSDDAMGSETLQGIITSWNPSAERIYGFSEAEAVGRSVFEMVPPAEHAHLRQSLARVAAGETVAHDVVHRIHKDGHAIPVSSTLAPLRDGTGQVVGISLISRDLSAEERAREQRDQLESDLAAAREAEQAREAFFNAISHDLRSPITAVIGWAELLEDEVAGPLNADQRSYVAMLQAAAGEQLSLLADLLDLARARAGTFTLRPRSTEVGSLAQATIELLAPEAVKAGLMLQADTPEGGLVLAIDRDRIAQVFRNLVGNALKFTPRGGRVMLRVRREGQQLRCEVEDTGTQIPPGDLTRLFLPFSQLAAGHKSGGTGLGLAISKAIVESHGGTIGVAGAPGGGNVFWFTLPVPPRADRAQTTANGSGTQAVE
ncbi:MAG: domain S-box [Cyanobacteria bacterium RYN_339]|nr:domain S-box [Cyanobacteria bacterium RYN_339]